MALSKNERITILSALVDRMNLAKSLGLQFGGDRDMYDILGYPLDITYENYFGKYERQDIAGRVVDLPAIDTWRNPPAIQDDGGSTSDEDPTSAFIQGLKTLIEKRRLWHYLQRVDRLAGIGRYGALLIGVRGATDLAQPLEKGSLKAVEDVIYLAAYSEGYAAVDTLVTGAGDERFGQPEYYKITTDSTKPAARVHWSRVIHVAEDLLDNEVYGRPRLKRIYDRLEDLMKIVGGGAEATWKVMDRGLQADIREGFTGEAQTLTDLETEIDEYLHGLRRFIRTAGVDIKDLGSTVVDPTGLFNIIASLIAAASDIPQRILLGSERGELASSQDAATWAGRISARQTQFAEPNILRPLIDRLVDAGALPEPEGGAYEIGVMGTDGVRRWPSLFEMSETEKADIAVKYSTAIASVAPPGSPETVVPIPEYRQHYLGLPAESEYGEAAVLDQEDADTAEEGSA